MYRMYLKTIYNHNFTSNNAKIYCSIFIIVYYFTHNNPVVKSDTQENTCIRFC